MEKVPLKELVELLNLYKQQICEVDDELDIRKLYFNVSSTEEINAIQKTLETFSEFFERNNKNIF